MIKYFCDMCQKDITMQECFHHVWRETAIHRQDLGIIKPENPPGKLLCDSCAKSIDDQLEGKHLPGAQPVSGLAWAVMGGFFALLFVDWIRQ